MLFEFNLYSSLLLLGFLQGLIFSFLLLWRGRREERRSDRWLSLLLLLCSLYIANWMLGFAGWYDAHNAYTTFMFYFPWNLELLIAPVIYLYFRHLTNHSFRIQWRHVWFFLPAVILLGGYSWAFLTDLVIGKWIQGRPLTDFFGTRGPNGQLYLPVLSTSIFELGWVYFFLILTMRTYRQYRRYIRDYFSDTEPIRFSWLRNLLAGIIAGITVVLIIDLIDDWIVELNYEQFWVAYFALAVLIYYLSIAGYTEGHRIPVLLEFSPEDKLNEEITPDPEIEVWKEKVSRYISEQRPYLNPNLSMPEMSEALGANASILSRVINQGFQQNFNDFINAHRVEAVKERLRREDSEHLTLLAIALDCGFNSKATFNRAFRKVTGMSPSEYKRQIREAPE